MSSLTDLPAAELSNLVSSKEISPVDIFKAFSSRIDKFNNDLNCFIQVFEDWEDNAKNAEKEIIRGDIKGPLHGIPIAIKDLIDYEGKITTAGSKILTNNLANRSAEIVSAMQSAGAIIVGKTHLVEFAYGPHGINSSFSQTKNPWDLSRIPGGSSSGSAAAIASSMVPIAVGSDTGGSIRMPASFCGVTGFKPSYNKINTRGVFPLSWTLDTVGPIAQTSKDCSLFVEEICRNQVLNNNFDPYKGFATSMLDNFDAILPLRLRVGVPSDDYFLDVEDEVKEDFWNSIDLMKSNGAEIIPIDLSWLSIARPINVVITMAEAINIHSKWLNSHHTEYSYEVISRLVAGENLSINDYLSSLRMMNWVQKEMDKSFSNFDVIACPTTPELPGLISDYSKENLSTSRKVVGGRISAFTSLFNVTRQPSLSSLSGFSSNGLPIGIMFTGRFNNDFGVLQVGNWFEKINEKKRLIKPNL